MNENLHNNLSIYSSEMPLWCQRGGNPRFSRQSTSRRKVSNQDLKLNETFDNKSYSYNLRSLHSECNTIETTKQIQ